MESKSIAHDLTGNHDILRLGLDGVKGDIVGSHPLESSRESAWGNMEEKKKMINNLTYGSACNLRKDLDKQILSRGTSEVTPWLHELKLHDHKCCPRFQRPPGALPSSMLGFEALTGGLDDFGFEDYLNVPQDSETLRPADMHYGMEVRLGLSKGPTYPGHI